MKKNPLKIGIDIHGVADANAFFFSRLAELLVENGHEVHILTGSEHSPELERHLREDLGLCWTHLFSITSHHKEQGTAISYIHGKPNMDEDEWNRTKAEYCKKHGIELHLDDSPVYGRFFETPFAKYYANHCPDNKSKVAVIGGSFNPVTMGHLKMAETVLHFLPEIRQVWLMPAFRHPFEKHKNYAGERIRMIRMVESGRIRYFGYEIDHRLSGETWLTFSRLLDDPDYRHLYDFHMVIGSDCLLDFDQKWKYAQELSRLVKFIIIPRPGYSTENYRGFLSEPPHIILNGAETPDVSASLVREKIRRKESIEGLVPEPVREFIMEKGLYREAEDLTTYGKLSNLQSATTHG
ncbi:MAG: adenylyltransferase/cytidyltransferase family protein [Desulfobacterales bacterium]